MIDLEKVVAGIEACNRISDNGSDCQNCPYYDDEDASELPFGVCNIHDMLADALALLKERNGDHALLERVRTGEVKKYHGDGIVLFNSAWYTAHKYGEAPERHGRWITTELGFREWRVECSACANGDHLFEDPEYWNTRKYCPECGAKMDKEEDDA